MWSWLFWKQTIERAVKTFAQAALALLTGNGLGLLDVNWVKVFSVAAMAAVVSILTSLGSNFLTKGPTPDLTKV